jgi:hypothetical protein
MGTEIDFKQKLADLRHLIAIERYQHAWSVLDDIDTNVEDGAWRTLTVDLKKQLDVLRFELEELINKQRSKIIAELDELMANDLLDWNIPRGEELLDALAKLLNTRDKQGSLVTNYARRLAEARKMKQITQEFLRVRREVEQLWDEGHQLQVSGGEVSAVRELYKRAVDLSREFSQYSHIDTLHKSAQTALDELIRHEKFSISLTDSEYGHGATKYLRILQQLENQVDDELVVLNDWNNTARWVSIQEARTLFENRLRSEADFRVESDVDEIKTSLGANDISRASRIFNSMTTLGFLQYANMNLQESVTQLSHQLEIHERVAHHIDSIRNTLEKQGVIAALELYRSQLANYEDSFLSTFEKLQQIQSELSERLNAELHNNYEIAIQLYSNNKYKEADALIEEVLRKYGKLV